MDYKLAAWAKNVFACIVLRMSDGSESTGGSSIIGPGVIKYYPLPSGSEEMMIARLSSQRISVAEEYLFQLMGPTYYSV